MSTTYEVDNGWVMVLIFGVILVVIVLFSILMWYLKGRMLAKGARASGSGEKSITVKKEE